MLYNNITLHCYNVFYHNRSTKLNNITVKTITNKFIKTSTSEVYIPIRSNKNKPNLHA